MVVLPPGFPKQGSLKSFFDIRLWVMMLHLVADFILTKKVFPALVDQTEETTSVTEKAQVIQNSSMLQGGMYST